MDFLNFEYLDSGFTSINSDSFIDLYESYRLEYKRIQKEVAIS